MKLFRQDVKEYRLKTLIISQRVLNKTKGEFKQLIGSSGLKSELKIIKRKKHQVTLIIKVRKNNIKISSNPISKVK